MSFIKEEGLIGIESLTKLKNSKVAVFGVGGVGGYAVEILARAGVGYIAVFDNDVVESSNINRQIIALNSTIGKPKTSVIKDRILDINKDIVVEENRVFYLPENASNYDLTKYDYIIDAIDTVSAKIELVKRAKSQGVKIISSMGTGNKLNGEFIVDDISKTAGCPLARVIRRELKKANVSGLKVVYSKEIPIINERKVYSIAYVPAAAGIKLAEEVIKELIK